MDTIININNIFQSSLNITAPQILPLPSAGNYHRHVMDSLPLELWLQTCHNLGDQDLRLVSHKLADIAATVLFHNITLFPTTKSFEKADNFLAYQHLNKHVRTLTYSGDTLPDAHPKGRPFQPCFETWKKDYLKPGVLVPNTDSPEFLKHFTEDYLQDAYANYCIEIEYQRSFRSLIGGMGTALLKDAFRLCNITAIEFKRSQSRKVSQGTPLNLSDLTSFQRRTLMNRGSRIRADQSKRYFRSLLDAACAEADNIGSFTVKGLQLHNFGGFGKAVISRIKHLDMNFYYDSEVQGTQIEWLAQSIALADNLQTLALSFEYRPPGVLNTDSNYLAGLGRPPKLPQLLRYRSHWPHLHTLKLDNFSSEADDFQVLLVAHRWSLRYIDVDLREIDWASWSELLRFIKYQLPQIEGNFSGKTMETGQMVSMACDLEYARFHGPSSIR